MILKNKCVFILLGVIVVAFGVALQVGIGGSVSYGEDKGNTIDDVVLVQKMRGDISKKSKDDSYLVYCSNLLEKRAEKKDSLELENGIQKDVIDFAAISWYAKEHNLLPTEDEMNAYMENLIREFRQSEEYDEYESAAKKYGTTYEEILRNDREAYRIEETINKVYCSIIMEYNGNMGDEEKYEEYLKDSNLKWKTFVQETVSKYKKKEEYASLNTKIRKYKSLGDVELRDVIREEDPNEK